MKTKSESKEKFHVYEKLEYKLAPIIIFFFILIYITVLDKLKIRGGWASYVKKPQKASSHQNPALIKSMQLQNAVFLFPGWDCQFQVQNLRYKHFDDDSNMHTRTHF